MGEAENYFLRPGYIIIAEEPYMIYTVLGSCVSVCIWDCVKKFGGMNHFMYSRTKDNLRNCMFGDVSTPHLIRLMSDMGSNVSDLRAHIIGGGQNPEFSYKVGDENVEVAEDILAKNRIEVVTRDVGGTTGRKVVFNNISGEVLVYKGINIRKSDWYKKYGE